MQKEMALVRAHAHEDPETMPYDRFCTLRAEALWLERYRSEQIAIAISKIFAKPTA